MVKKPIRTLNELYAELFVKTLVKNSRTLSSHWVKYCRKKPKKPHIAAGGIVVMKTLPFNLNSDFGLNDPFG